VHRHSGSPTVEIDVEVEAEVVTLAVRDAGQGIPEQVLERFRGTGTAGIGLAGIQERVADLGGELHIYSNGAGTLLKASIPLHGRTLSAAQQSSAA
jgi:signal transduction histidine kinase